MSLELHAAHLNRILWLASSELSFNFREEFWNVFLIKVDISES